MLLVSDSVTLTVQRLCHPKTNKEAGQKTPGNFALDAQGLARDFTKVICKAGFFPGKEKSPASADHFGASPSLRPWASQRARPRRGRSQSNTI
jgi:hypothetical protein